MPVRWWRGLKSAAGVLTIPLGGWACRGVGEFYTRQRLEQGLVILLPGIQGKSSLESSIARGLDDAGVDAAIEVYDWTSGWWFLMPYHLCAVKRNRREAARLAGRVCDYRERFPGRPVHIIGHSGGAGLALFAMEAMPADLKVTSLILLAPAVSPAYDLTEALAHVETVVWSVHSRRDLLPLGISTLVLGTIDRRHTIAAGVRGFDAATTSDNSLSRGNQLREQPYVPAMLRSWHCGGHFGCTNRLFAAEWLAPKLRSEKDDS